MGKCDGIVVHRLRLFIQNKKGSKLPLLLGWVLSARSLHILKVDKMLKGLQLSAAVLSVYMDMKCGIVSC